MQCAYQHWANMAQHLPQKSIDIKVTVIHHTYREHYVVFRRYATHSLEALLHAVQDRMVRSVSRIMYPFNDSFVAGGGWTGRITWIDKHGDEILLLGDQDFLDYVELIREGEMGIINIILASSSPEPAGTLKQKPFKYDFKSAFPSVPSTWYAPVPPAAGTMSTKRPKPTLPLHKNIRCDVCEGEIRGHRYKCMTCQNYDLCMSCESKYRHKEHMMLRLPTPDISCHGAYNVFDELR